LAETIVRVSDPHGDVVDGGCGRLGEADPPYSGSVKLAPGTTSNGTTRLGPL
jgi:hypothetical protein